MKHNNNNSKNALEEYLVGYYKTLFKSITSTCQSAGLMCAENTMYIIEVLLHCFLRNQFCSQVPLPTTLPMEQAQVSK